MLADAIQFHPGYVLGDRCGHRGHIHTKLELGFCRDGHGTFCVAGKILPFDRGSAVVITPSERHYAQATPGTDSCWDFLYVDLDRALGAVVPDPALLSTDGLCGPSFANVLTPAEQPRLCRLIDELTAECGAGHSGWHDAVRGLLWTCAALLQRLPDQDPEQHRRRTTSLNAIDPAIDLVNHRFAEAVTVTELAAACAMSQSTLHRHFMRACGCSPQNYLMRHRVHQAANLLRHSDQAVAEIASRSGFSAPSSLYRQFKQHLGCGPEAWRQGATGATHS
ncbi:MAG: AraC family transcriptional regulator [Planctomycetota bacterium]|jgi:AraC family transcriptional regulator|nr:AraC family transcriptional regulator [Planctomycetota bacterium]